MIIGKIKGSIFDVDGVLLDSMEIWTDLGSRYLVSEGRTPEDGLGDILFCMSMEQGAEYLRERYSLERSADEVMDGLRDMMRDFYFREVKAKPLAGEVLKRFAGAGIRITAATSSPREHVERALKRNGLYDYVERIFTSAEMGTSKHSPEIYDAAAGYMGTKPSETMVFEDSLYALKTASGAGYVTAGVFDEKGETDQKGLEEVSDIYIRDYRELLELI